MTEYTLGMTFACPPALMDGANDLFAWVGYGWADHDTFFIKKDEDGNDDPHMGDDGNPYAIANGRFKSEFIAQLDADLLTYPIPDWCYDNGDPATGTLMIDTVAATNAQTSLALVPEEEPTTLAKVAEVANVDYIYVDVTGETDAPGVTPVVLGPFSVSFQGTDYTYWIRGLNGRIGVGVDLDHDDSPNLWVPIDVSTVGMAQPQRKAVIEARAILNP